MNTSALTLKCKLAIVIPAYKAKFLDSAIRSILSQSNQNFQLYVIDDGSPEGISRIVDQYTGNGNVTYYRFEKNLGGVDLIGHWNRSVQMADADWIWLFSDDDVAQPGCVQAFFDTLEVTQAKFDVYRFNIQMIDQNDNVICVKAPHPESETGLNFLKRRLKGISLSAAIEYIFCKQAFIRESGFVNFPLAFCSDDASWIAFAGNKDIFTIPHYTISWRSSQLNISSVRGLQHQKIDALLSYCLWVKERFPDVMDQDLENWLLENFKYVYGRLTLRQKFVLADRIAAILNRKKSYYLKKIIFNGLL